MLRSFKKGKNDTFTFELENEHLHVSGPQPSSLPCLIELDMPNKHMNKVLKA